MKVNIWKSFLVLVVFSLCFVAVRGLETTVKPKAVNQNGTTKTTGLEDSEKPVRQMYTDLEKRLKSIISSTLKMSMPTMMREVYSRNLSSLCMSSLLQLTGALRQMKLWAFQMLDSSGKIPNGFLAGTLTSLGNYDECVKINVDQPAVKIKGQYCFVEIIPPLPKWRPYMSLHIPVPELRNVSSPDTIVRFISNLIHNFYIVSIKTGLCVPSSCSKDDVYKLLQIVPEKLDFNWKFTIDHCETKESFEFSSIQIFLVYLFMLIVIAVGIATLADLILVEELLERKDAKGMIFRVVRCFSLRLNIHIISKYKCPESNLKFVYGFMFLSVLWGLAANIFINVNYDISANFLDALIMTTNMFYQMLTSRIFPCQTLFFMSAFVTSYKWMKSPEKKFCVWKYIFKAYWRYTPAYLLLIALLMLSPGWGSGPSWTTYMAPIYENCRDNWWTNILYINNYVNPDQMCLSHSWFLAVAAQLHVIGIIVFIPLKRRPKFGLLVNFLLAVASLLAIFIFDMYNETPPNEIISFLNTKDRIYYAKQTYHNTYYHLVPYCAGIFAGYVVATRPTMKISWKLSCSMWSFSGLCVIAALVLVTLWSDGDLPRPIICASYDAISKLIWAAFLVWITISLAIEQKGVCYDILSWGAFPFFSRLTFPMYLFNSPIITIVFGLKKSHIFVSHFEIFYNLGTLILCNVIISYAFHVVVESPILQLTKVVNKSCGFKTFNYPSTTNGSGVLEGVTMEKYPKATTQKGLSRMKPADASRDKPSGKF